MAYVLPMVQVYQEYESTSGSSVATDLPVCIVGPCYHIIDADNDETLAYAADYTTEGIEKAVFPNNQPGALIDEDSVSIRLSNVYVDVVSDVSFGDVSDDGDDGDTGDTGDTGGDTGDTGGGDDTPAPASLFLAHAAPLAAVQVTASFEQNTIVFDNGDVAEDVEIGDYCYFFDADGEALGTEYTYRVSDIDVEEDSIQLNRSIPDDAATFTLKRHVDDVYLDASSAGVELDCNSELYTLFALRTTLNDVEVAIDTATVYIGYRALRQDLSSIMELDTVDEIEGKLGSVVPENPLAYGVMIAMTNTTTSVLCIGVDSDDLVGYTSANDRLENVDPLYCIVPLTFEKEVLSMFKSSCEQLSEPDLCKWRIVLGCSELQTTTTPAQGYGKCSQDSNKMNLVFTATKGFVSEATGLEEEIRFQSDSVDAGDTLTITYNGEDYVYTVASVAAEDILTVTPSNPFADEIMDVEVQFKITHDLDKSEQAKNVASVSTSYGTKRFVHIWPDICIIEERELPGYYLACAVGGGIAGLPSHYGFTNLSMAGIGGVKHASDYFSQSQLNTIAEGGTFIFVQESEESLPYVRHQLTTDMSTTEFCELSFVKNFDYVCYCCRDVLRPYIGKWNVTEAAISAISTSLSACLESLKLDVYEKIGSRVLKYEIVSIEQLATDRTRVECYVNTWFPYPLNVIGLHLVSQ